MNNLGFCKYTYVHKKIVEYMVEKYIKDTYVKEIMLEKAKNHDMDKLTSYLFYPKSTCSKIHRENNAHHINDLYKDMFDYIEIVLDWESARYSKDDKPLNAYDTLYIYYPEYEEKILPILKGFGLDISNTSLDEDIKNYAENLIKTVSEEDILKEIFDYLRRISKDNDF